MCWSLSGQSNPHTKRRPVQRQIYPSAYGRWIDFHTFIGLKRMRFKFKIKHLLAWMLVVSIAISSQLRLNYIISSGLHEIDDVESMRHQDAMQAFADEFPAAAGMKSSTSVDGIVINTSSSVLDYCLFRRTIDCKYNLNIHYFRRELAHSSIPDEFRIDKHYVDAPSRHQIKQSIRLTATPWGYQLDLK